MNAGSSGSLPCPAPTVWTHQSLLLGSEKHEGQSLGPGLAMGLLPRSLIQKPSLCSSLPRPQMGSSQLLFSPRHREGQDGASLWRTHTPRPATPWPSIAPARRVIGRAPGAQRGAAVISADEHTTRLVTRDISFPQTALVGCGDPAVVRKSGIKVGTTGGSASPHKRASQAPPLFGGKDPGRAPA